MTYMADALLQSAVETLIARDNTFTVQPWREIMAKNQAAVEKSKEVKVAAKKVAAKGVTPYKHKSVVKDITPAGSGIGQTEAEVDAPAAGMTTAGTFGAFAQSQLARGIDSAPPGVVYSNRHQPNATGANTMATKTPQTPEAQAAREAAAKAKIVEKEAKLKAVAEAKAAREAEKAAKAEAKAKEREAAAAERAARPKADATESMKTLADRVKAGAYVKGANGQLRADDDVARTLEMVDVKHTVGFLLKALALDTNPYAHLNYGQQSMNLRNKLRGALHKGSIKVAGQDLPLTVASLQKLLEDNPGMKYQAPAPAPKAEAKEAVSA